MPTVSFKEHDPVPILSRYPRSRLVHSRPMPSAMRTMNRSSFASASSPTPDLRGINLNIWALSRHSCIHKFLAVSTALFTSGFQSTSPKRSYTHASNLSSTTGYSEPQVTPPRDSKHASRPRMLLRSALVFLAVSRKYLRHSISHRGKNTTQTSVP